MRKCGLFFTRAKNNFLYALDPVRVMTDDIRHKWYYNLFLPASGWMLFFSLVGLYRKTGSDYSAGKIVILALTGFVLGYACVFVASVLLSFLFVLFSIRITTGRTIACVALSHTYMTFSMILGLLYFIIGKGSPTAFGITGLLCTLLPIYSGIRKLTGKNAFTAPILVSFIGVLMLIGWNIVLRYNL